MFTDLGKVILKTGEEMQVGVVSGPDGAWRERISGFLNHKGGIWNWQVGEQLAQSLGVESCFYLLHQNGVPFSHIMTTTLRGVGLLGHVFTVPERRGQGAASLLMQRQMEHFRAAGGRALYLRTGYDSPPYHIYQKHGFSGIGSGSGCMTWTEESLLQFEESYLGPGAASVKRLAWEHWPASAALFISEGRGVIRNLSAKLFGRCLVEGPLLPLLQAENQNAKTGSPARAYVAQKIQGGGVVGLSTLNPHPLWPGTSVLDVYCHPGHWHLADQLIGPLADLESPVVAYTESGFAEKEQALTAAGFVKNATLPRHLALPERPEARYDVDVYERASR